MNSRRSFTTRKFNMSDPLPDQKVIVSIKPYTPPTSGDKYLHKRLGIVRLRKRDGGIHWWCETADGKRISLCPMDMTYVHDE